jgi:hypothetical protein
MLVKSVLLKSTVTQVAYSMALSNKYWSPTLNLINTAYCWKPGQPFIKQSLPDLNFINEFENSLDPRLCQFTVKSTGILGHRSTRVYNACNYSEASLNFLNRLSLVKRDSESYRRIFEDTVYDLPEATEHLTATNRACKRLYRLYIMLE